MVTSTASKPAASKAAAISTWPLMPCSRRTATPGGLPPRALAATTGADSGKASASTSKGTRKLMPASWASHLASYSWRAHSG